MGDRPGGGRRDAAVHGHRPRTRRRYSI